jgi:hypothetical protein
VSVRRRLPNVPGGRSKSYLVSASDDEAVALAALADAHGVTVPRLLLESALAAGGETPSERRGLVVLLHHLDRQISGIAVNVNQAARRANVGDGFPVVEARELLREGRDAVVAIRDAVMAVAGLGVR